MTFSALLDFPGPENVKINFGTFPDLWEPGKYSFHFSSAVAAVVASQLSA